MRNWNILFTIIFATVFLMSCEKDKNPVGPDETEFSTFQSSNIKEGAVYFSFATEEAVPVYDLKFGEYNRSPEFFVNPTLLGGEYVQIYQVENANLAEVDSVSNASFSIDADTSMTGGNWYNYDFQTHTVSAKQNVYVVKTADQRNIKFQITGWSTDGSNNTYNIDYAVWDAASKSFGAVNTASFSFAASEEAHFQFDTGIVTPADWDVKLCISPVTMPGVGVISFPTIFFNTTENVKAIGVEDQAFEDVNADQVAGLQAESAQSPIIGSDWFAYDENTHVVSSKEITYVVETVSGERAKFRVLNYYNEDGVSGFMTLEYDK